MRKKTNLRFAVLISLLLIVPLCLTAKEKKKPPEQFCSFSFVVLQDADGKPIKNASVVLHFLDKHGNQERDGFQLKTDKEGKTIIDDLPYGRLRVQAVAPNLQTYGDDFDVNQPKQELVIRLKPPAPQLSTDDSPK